MKVLPCESSFVNFSADTTFIVHAMGLNEKISLFLNLGSTFMKLLCFPPKGKDFSNFRRDY